MNNMLGMKYGLRIDPNKTFMELLLESRSIGERVERMRGLEDKNRSSKFHFLSMA